MANKQPPGPPPLDAVDPFPKQQRNERGHFIKGNTLGPGEPRMFETPEDVIASVAEYLEWCEDNPFEVLETGTFKDGSFEYTSRKTRIPSQSGYGLWLGRHPDILMRWANGWFSKTIQEGAVTGREMIRTRQIELGAAGILNPMFTARVAGLAEKSEIQMQANMGPPPGSKVDDCDVPNLVHPDAPIEHQLSDAPLLFSQRQLDAGVPYPMKTIDHDEAAE